MLPTVNQLSSGIRKRKKHRKRVAALLGCPQKRAVIYRIATMTPRKPNSARRTIAKTRVISSNKRTFVKIPGVGEHFLQAHSVVLIRGHGPTDSPGINYNMIRGLCDFIRVETFGRRNRRSKFGVKRLEGV